MAFKKSDQSNIIIRTILSEIFALQRTDTEQFKHLHYVRDQSVDLFHKLHVLIKQ